MEDYYYIKFKPIKYEDKPYYLCLNDQIREYPEPLKIFGDIEKAIEYKHDKLSDERYQGTYMFDYYTISIERL